MPRPTVSDRVRLALPIVLIGPMGAGKSRVGQRLAASVGAPFIDTDQRIADRYGPIGVAFTYLACLYTASFCFLATAVLGQVIATDRGKLGQWIQGTEPATETKGGSDGT